MKVKIEDGQTLFDIAIQELGTIEAIHHIVDVNDMIESVSSPLQDNSILVYDSEVETVNQAVRLYFTRNGYRPRTGISALKTATIDDGGNNDILKGWIALENAGEDDELLSYPNVKNSNVI